MRKAKRGIKKDMKNERKWRECTERVKIVRSHMQKERIVWKEW